MDTEKLKSISAEIDAFEADSSKATQEFKNAFLSKKGTIKSLFVQLKEVPPEKRKELGLEINKLKIKAEEKLAELQSLEQKSDGISAENDLTRPGYPIALGSRHPVSVVKNQMIEILKQIGFVVSEGPEIETISP